MGEEWETTRRRLVPAADCRRYYWTDDDALIVLDGGAHARARRAGRALALLAGDIGAMSS